MKISGLWLYKLGTDLIVDPSLCRQPNHLCSQGTINVNVLLARNIQCNENHTRRLSNRCRIHPGFW